MSSRIKSSEVLKASSSIFMSISDSRRPFGHFLYPGVHVELLMIISLFLMASPQLLVKVVLLIFVFGCTGVNLTVLQDLRGNCRN